MLTILFAAHFATASSFRSRPDAVAVVDHVEGVLRDHLNRGARLAAETLLAFIAVAKTEGALELPLTYGAMDERNGGAGFESPTTALRVEFNFGTNGVTLFLVHVRLARELMVRGYAGRELKATFIQVQDSVRLSLGGGTTIDRVEENLILRQGVELQTQFGLNAVSPKAWGDVHFVERAVGFWTTPCDQSITGTIRPSGTALPKGRP